MNMNMAILQTFENFNVINLSVLFIISITLNYFLFKIIKLGYLGDIIRVKFNSLLETNLNLLNLFIFIISLMLMFYLNKNIIYLDENVVLTTKIDNSTFIISGEAINTIFNNLGSAGVFSAGARIAASLVSKSKIGLLPKVGIIGSTGAGFTATYRIVTNATSATQINNNQFSLETGPIEITIENLKTVKDSGDTITLLTKLFGVSPNYKLNLSEQLVNGTRKITDGGEVTSKILEELDKQNPN